MKIPRSTKRISQAALALWMGALLGCGPLPKEGQERVQVSFALTYPEESRSSERGVVSCARATDWRAGIGKELVVLLPSGQSFPDDPSALGGNAIQGDADNGSVTLSAYMDTSYQLRVYRFPTGSDLLDSTATSNSFTFRNLVTNNQANFTLSVVPFGGTPQVLFSQPSAETAITSADQSVSLDNLTEGDNVTLTVQLGKRPKDNVTLLLKPDPESDPLSWDELETLPTLVFTPTNWDTDQTVTLQARKDGVGDGDRQVQIQTDNLTTTDPDYQNCYLPLLETHVLDQDNTSVAQARTAEWGAELEKLSVFSAEALDNLTQAALQGIFDEEVGHLTPIDNLTGPMIRGAFNELGQQQDSLPALLSGTSSLLQGMIPVLDNHTSSTTELAQSVRQLATQSITAIPPGEVVGDNWTWVANEWTQGVIRGFPGSVGAEEVPEVTAEWLVGLLEGAVSYPTTPGASSRSLARLDDSEIKRVLSGGVEGVFAGLDNVSATLPLSATQVQSLTQLSAKRVSESLVGNQISMDNLSAILDNVSYAVGDGLSKLSLSSAAENSALLKYLEGLNQGLAELSAAELTSILTSTESALNASAQVFFSSPIVNTSSSGGVSFAPVIQSMTGSRDDNTTHDRVLWTITVSDDKPETIALSLNLYWDNGTINEKTYTQGSTNTTSTPYVFQIWMSPYDPSENGTMRVTVTDDNGSFDNYTYKVVPNMFPEY